MFGPKFTLVPDEVILLKKGGSAKWEGLISSTGKVDGKIHVTTERIIFTTDFGTNFNMIEMIEIWLKNIDHVTREKYMLIFPQVSVVLKSGEKYSFPLLNGGDELANLIEQQMKLKEEGR
jgi:hypothetical protein